MSNCKLVAIGNLVERVQSWNPARKNPDDTFDYIDLSAIDQDKKRITVAHKVTCSEAPSRARQIVSTGDILVSTVRPNLNGVAQVPPELNGATASTGFCVLRPRTALLDSSYIYHWVRTPRFVIDMVSKATGASYPAVSDRIVFDSMIPCPPITEQRRIAAILDQADALRAKRREALAQLDSLTQSIFIEMFGDPATNPLSWQTAVLDSVALKITDGEHQTPRRTNSGIKLLSARNIRDGFLDFSDVDYIDLHEYNRIAKRCNPEFGDVLISCSGSIGRVASVEINEPLGMVRSAALVKPDVQKVKTKFLESYLRTPFLNRLMIKSAHSSSQANLFQGQIRALPVFVPPIQLQSSFEERVRAVQGIRASITEALHNMDNLFASLQHRAFRGEL